MPKKSKAVIFDTNPGRNAQTYGIARQLDTDMDLIHEPSVGVIGTKGDSQCYMGVQRKVEAIHEHLRTRLGRGEGQMPMRLVQPEYTVATSDGMRNGTREMRYSLIGREVTHDTVCEHLSASGLEGTIAVVACDKPPVGTLAGLLPLTLSQCFKWLGIRMLSIRNASRVKRAPAMAAAVACSPTTPCKPLLVLLVCSLCKWLRPHPMTHAD